MKDNIDQILEAAEDAIRGEVWLQLDRILARYLAVPATKREAVLEAELNRIRRGVRNEGRASGTILCENMDHFTQDD